MTKPVIEALFDVHESTLRTAEGSDNAWMFKARARPILEKFERELRADGCLDRTSFIHTWSWTFYMAQTGNVLTLKHPDNGRSLTMRVNPIENGYRDVFFTVTQGRKSPEEAAAVVWEFLMGVAVPESYR